MSEIPALPCSLDPLPEESLPGYLLRLAHRLELAPNRILQLTGLSADSVGASAPRTMMVRLEPAAARSFARTTRLTTAELAGLCMSSLSDRYPWTAPTTTSDRWGPRSLASPWVFTDTTRYCPQCLAGDGSSIQQRHGGAWRKTWRLPIMFACPLHRRLLEHLCPACHRPPMSAVPGATGYLIPRIHTGGLHPAQCRAPDSPSARGHRHSRLCGARLDTPAEPVDAPNSAVLGELLAVQHRLQSLLHPGGPADGTSVGQPATSAQYFADLRLVCSLITGTWPASQSLIPVPALADAVDQHITGLSTQTARRFSLYDIPPLDPRPGTALIAAAVRVLDSSDLRALSEFLLPNQDGAKSQRNRWIRRYQRTGQECSDGFRDALEPLLTRYRRQGRHGRRAPARQINFGPEHIPE